MPECYACPSNGEDGGEEGITHYSVILGDETIFPPITKGNPDPKNLAFGGRGVAAISDGTSNTVLVVERRKGGCWMDPTQEIPFAALDNGIDWKFARDLDDEGEADALGSPHANGINAGFADGAVRFLTSQIKLEVLKAIATCAGGESGCF